jgi:glycerol-3-phosphate dehydrogenase
LVTPLSIADVEGVYAGLRPLLAGENEQTSQLSRDHQVGHPVPGLVVVAGGKYTTYRKMAQDAVDEAVRALDASVAGSCTTDVPLVGADGYRALWNRRYALARQSGLHVVRIEHLLNRYGSLIHELLELVAKDPSLAEPLPGADDYLGVEVVYAATHEGALHVDDVLARRTRASIETWSRGVQAVETVARLMGGVLGWSQSDIDREIDAYKSRVEAERKSQQASDDVTAEEARLAAVDLG